MRKTLITTVTAMLMANSALAADDVEPGQVVEFDEGRFEWSGVYAGLSIGRMQLEDEDPDFPGVTPAILYSEGEGSTYGGFIGINFQNDRFVYGAEYEYVEFDTQFVGVSPAIGPLPIFLEDGHILKARFGYAFTDRVMAYGFGGAMHSKINIGLSDWTPLVGAGIDFALTDNIVLGAQYTHSWFEGYDGTRIDGSIDHATFRIGWKF